MKEIVVEQRAVCIRGQNDYVPNLALWVLLYT